jgi:predicted cobalt transporter CbtA
MTIRILLAALAAGLFAGILMTPVQLRQTVPLILHAEQFEAAPWS